MPRSAAILRQCNVLCHHVALCRHAVRWNLVHPATVLRVARVAIRAVSIHLARAKIIEVDAVTALAEMRESDDDVMRRGSIFVDTRDDAVLAGDLAGPLGDGVISAGDIRADLAELVAGIHPGRTDPDEITVFKSVGLALEDLAAARLAFDL